MSDHTSVQVAPLEPKTAAEPALILGKFKTQADLEQAYSNLEKKIGAPAAPAAPASPVSPPAIAPTGVTPTPATPVVEIEKYQKEFTEKGELSPETYTALAASGFPKAVVDQYIAGQQATAAQAEQEVLGVVGGKENYTNMVNWAASALNPQEQQSYNTAINSSDRNAVKLAVEGLKARYSAAHGNDPKLVGGSINARPAGFASTREMVEAMQDPRYNKDPAYRASVVKKVEAMA